MSDELLNQYDRELAYLRRMGAEFARAHPKIAGRLRLGPDGTEDPHVSRLIESAAFLNARTRQKLEDDFPELTDALLGVLYPHYLAPIPSFTILKFVPVPDLTEPFELRQGTMLETARIHGEPVRYRTGYPTTLYPLEVAGLSLRATPFEAPLTPHSTGAAAVLRLTLRRAPAAPPISEIAPDSLRFYLGGQPQHAYVLYELLLSSLLQVAVATSSNDSKPQLLPPTSVHRVGFAKSEGMLPYPNRSQLGYRLLTEYFAFPQKFRFLDLKGLAGPVMQRAEDKLEVFFYLRKTSLDLQQNLNAMSMALGCTPAVNLFEKRAEPIRLRHREPELRVVPDARRVGSMEVYSVNSVSASSPQGETYRYRPFYATDHQASERVPGLFYHPTRRKANEVDDQDDRGTEVYLRLVDLDFDPTATADHVLAVETTCFNRDLPAKLPFGGDQPKFRFSDGGGPIEHIRCLTPPTPTRRPQQERGTRWKLVSHLLLNHLSLDGGDGATQALQETLRLYDGIGDPSNLRVIDSILSIKSEAATLRVAAGVQAGFCRGTVLHLELDEAGFAEHGIFLFASVLEVFLGLSCSMNSFVQLRATTNAREGALCQWPARSGTRPLV